MSTDERRARAIEDTTNDETQEGLQYVLIRGFSAMGYGRPISAAEDILREAARAIRASDEAAGMVLVPREATEEMIQAGANAQYPMGPAEVWRAMIAAATESDNG